MPFRQTQTAIALLAIGAATAGAQYSTPVGSGAAKPKTLRATAVLEWTGSLEKPNASRLMPIAVWDGERYQPAALYLARPAPLAFETGTQYELERSGEPAGLFDVRGAAQLGGEWVGIGRFKAEAAPAPPAKLKVSKHLPGLSSGKADAGKADPKSGGDPAGDRPTLHRKTGDSGSETGSKSDAPQTSTGGKSPSTPADSSSTPATTDDRPTLHKRTDSGSDSTTGSTTGSASGSASGNASGSTPPAASTSGAPDDSSSGSDADRPTLHRRADPASSTSSDTSKSPETDPDRPTLHRHDDTAKASDEDSDRPTLHRARTGTDAAASVDPDRPHLRYGRSDDAEGTTLPVRLEGVPSSMQQIVAVSDSAPGDPRPYQYHWTSPDDAAKMQAALASIAARAAASPGASAAQPVAQFGPASHAGARKPRQAHASAPAAQQAALVDEHFAAYELSFSGGATVVYSAHTAGDAGHTVYVTLIAQPDFSGKPQVLLQHVARADRLDEVPAMQLVDAVDTDNDQRAELVFQLNGAAQAPAAPAAPSEPEAGSSTDSATQFARDAAASARASALAHQAAGVPERSFAIYRVTGGKALQVFSTGPLP